MQFIGIFIGHNNVLRTRMIVPLFLVSKLCLFDYFFQTILFAINLKPLRISSCNFIGISIWPGQCVEHKNNCFIFLTVLVMPH